MLEVFRYQTANGEEPVTHWLSIVILLCGGPKKTQATDIKTAKGYWADWKRRQA
jgi:hypothetical protein